MLNRLAATRIIWTLAIAACALIPRILLLRATSDSGLFADMIEYFGRAEHLYRTGSLLPDAFRVPGFTAALASSFFLFGPSVGSARILQTLVMVACAVAGYALAATSVSSARAVVAGLIVALYPGLLLYTVYVMGEPLFALFTLVTLLSIRTSTAVGSATGGLLAGLAMMSRQAGASLTMAILPWLLLDRKSWGLSLRDSALFLVGVIIVVTPWVVRNERLFGRFMPLESSGGVIFLMANYEGATGRYLLSDWDTVHERYLGVLPDEFVRSSEGYRLGREFIAKHPRRFLSLLPRRLAYFLDLEGREHVWLYTANYFGQHSSIVVWCWGLSLLFSFPLLASAGIAAVTLGPPLNTTERLISGVLGLVTLQQIMVYGDARFHLPLVPLVAILAVRPLRGGHVPKARLIAGGVCFATCWLWWGLRLSDQLAVLRSVSSESGASLSLPY